MSKPYCPVCESEFKRGIKFCPNDGAELVIRTKDGESGKVFAGRYTILNKLGSGGMGVVYRAKQITTGKTVAIKVISKKMTADPESAARFQREMRIQSKLEHPNIVTVYDFDKSPKGQFFIVMPYVDGRSLDELVTELGYIELPVFLDLAYQILEGVEYAHRKGIIHRDLKAENIIVTELESKLAAMILDFGIAKAVDADTDAMSLGGANLTKDGMILGTPAYMSPEQGRGEIKEIGVASDIYSLGVIFYQMVTGALPFESDSPFGMIAKHINEKPPKPTLKNPKLNKGLETVILRCLKKEPGKRYASAENLKEALEGLNVRPGKTRTSATMATLAIIRQPRKDADDFGDDTDSRPRRSRFLSKLLFIMLVLAGAVGYFLWSQGLLVDYIPKELVKLWQTALGQVK
ncbi:MAG: serine/threonine protein kinase [Nitrospinota bacterium]|nr:serine/threonine protein kinase [Nitrospinota bacterium]